MWKIEIFVLLRWGRKMCFFGCMPWISLSNLDHQTGDNLKSSRLFLQNFIFAKSKVWHKSECFFETFPLLMTFSVLYKFFSVLVLNRTGTSSREKFNWIEFLLVVKRRKFIALWWKMFLCSLNLNCVVCLFIAFLPNCNCLVLVLPKNVAQQDSFSIHDKLWRWNHQEKTIVTVS